MTEEDCFTPCESELQTAPKSIIKPISQHSNETKIVVKDKPSQFKKLPVVV